MKLQPILESLPDELEWIVLFRLSAIRALVDDATIRRMYFLPADVSLADFSHVILSSGGRGLAPLEGDAPRPAGEPPLPLRRLGGSSLWERHAEALRALPLDESDCLGFGAEPPAPPAYLHLSIEDGVGSAIASFRSEPPRAHYDLLPAVGVDYRGGQECDGRFLARFSNRVSAHVHAGALSGFSRTANCNSFFFRHGVVDEELAEGLRRAAADRLGWGRTAARRRVRDLAREATSRPLPMTCRAPGAAPADYGDLVPLGFLLRALERSGESGDAFEGFARRQLAGGVRQKLEEKREGRLWAFHSGRLVTATDSALVLLGVEDPAAVEELERFSDGEGGYYPQLWSAAGERGTMRADPCNRHWRQVDYATTCLVRGLRAEAGLPPVTPLERLAAGFESRAGLYFANPWLVDWCLALALGGDPAARALAARLRGEILAAGNTDGGFGAFDTVLSTALAVLALDALGYRGRRVLAAQLRLLEWLEESAPRPATPFYSTFVAGPASGAVPEAHLVVAEELHELSLYEDTHHVITASLVQLALGVPCEDEDPADAPPSHPGGHPRYRCDQADYVARFALPPYAPQRAAGGAVRS